MGSQEFGFLCSLAIVATLPLLSQQYIKLLKGSFGKLFKVIAFRFGLMAEARLHTRFLGREVKFE